MENTPYTYHAETRPPRRGLPWKQLLVILLLSVLLAGLSLVLFHILEARRPGPAQTLGCRAVELDEGWSARFEQTADTEQQQLWIDEMLTEVQALGADTLLWNARTPDGHVLYRDPTKTFVTAPAVTANDTFTKKFDPLEYMCQQAAARGMGVMLLPASDSGTLTAPALSAQMDETLAAAAKAYDLVLCAPAPTENDLTLYPCLNADGSESGLTFARCDAVPIRLLTVLETQENARVILGSYSALLQDPTVLTLLAGASPGHVLPDLTAYLGSSKYISHSLVLCYPTTTVYTDTCFLMGTSDPSRPLYIRGGSAGTEDVEVFRGGTEGVWGYLVQLEKGDNYFTLTQPNSDPVRISVKRAVAGSSTPALPFPDGSQPLPWGTKVQVSGTACASVLSNYKDPDSIMATLYAGATVAVYDSVNFQQGAKSTHAYKLANGGWLLAKDVTALDPDTPNAQFSAIHSRFDPETNCTVLELEGTGTPAVTHYWSENRLALTFHNAACTGRLPIDGEYIVDGMVKDNGDETFTLHIILAEADSLWGWHVDYDTAANSTKVYLKHAPALSGDPTAPLRGVRVLLDPGHGGKDNGALGSPGYTAPAEKDINLAEAWAARHRLEQLGATVIMTREDDSFPSLSERLNLLNQTKPDFFIALHHNSTSLATDVNLVEGVECYWFYTEGMELSSRLVHNISAVTGRQPRGTYYNYFFVTRSNICPAVLLESGFVTNPAEYENCVDETMLWEQGSAIAQSILECVSDTAPAPDIVRQDAVSAEQG